MSTTIWKHPIKDGAHQSFPAGEGARIVHVGTQHGQPMLWIEHDAETVEDGRVHVRVVGTGDRIPEDGVHRGTFLVNEDRFVFHVYEIIDPARRAVAALTGGLL